MKQRVISVLAILALCLSMSAKTYEIDMKTVLGSSFNFALTGWEYQGITFVTDKGTNEIETMPAYYSSKGEVRLYPGNTLTIKYDHDITSVKFHLSENGVERLAEITVSTGEIVQPDANPLCWEGCAQEITFTVGETAKYGTTAYPEFTSGQLSFTAITLVSEEGEDDSDTDTDPDIDPDQPDDPNTDPDPDEPGDNPGTDEPGDDPNTDPGDDPNSDPDPDDPGDDPNTDTDPDDDPDTGEDEPGQSGIVDARQDGEVQYYSLQGIRLEQPIRGEICIAIVNGRTTKILIP